jgi:hypothetical protein
VTLRKVDPINPSPPAQTCVLFSKNTKRHVPQDENPIDLDLSSAVGKDICLVRHVQTSSESPPTGTMSFPGS